MKWTDFENQIHEAKESWAMIIESLPDFHKYFKKTEIVISLENWHLIPTNDLTVFALSEHLDLFKDSLLKDRLRDLNITLKEAEAKRKKADKSDSKRLDDIIASLKADMLALPLSEFEIVDDFGILLIFPSVNIEAIQVLKNHPLINSEKTCMCKACIRVYL